jgi:hypothetical protein
MDPGYTGTLTLNARLAVADGASFFKGNINQPNGPNSDLTLADDSRATWGGTVLNSGSNLSTIHIGFRASLDVNTQARTIGSNLDNSGTVTFKSLLAGPVTFANNAGITNNIGGDIVFDTVDIQPLQTDGTGVILNSGTVEKSTDNDTVSISQLPLINDDPIAASATLIVRKGTLAFTRPAQQNGVSVFQNRGTTQLYNGTVLQADYGYTQQGGYLLTYGGDVAKIDTTEGGGNADVKIHGGVVQVGADGTYGILAATGSVTMDGGTLAIQVGGTTLQHDEFNANLFTSSFTIGANASLQVDTNNIPVGGVPPNTTIHIIRAETISGTFQPENILFLPGGIWSADVNDNSDSYDLYT